VGGRLFGVRGRRSEDSELVIFLTPRIARATTAPAVPGADPGSVLLQRAEQIMQSAREGN
jgi:type II secretory pathway component GspD/PulD (secretin)